MKITYTGIAGALSPVETRKIEVKFGKIAKLLDARKGERDAHVVLSRERRLTRTEITVRYQDHDLVGIGSASDTFAAMGVALEKLEKQILKLRERVRDSHRGPKEEKAGVTAETAAGSSKAATAPGTEADPPAEPKVFRVNHHERRKPITLDEALLEIEGRNYIVYRDAETGRVSMLVRRRDGNFDLIEA